LQKFSSSLTASNSKSTVAYSNYCLIAQLLSLFHIRLQTLTFTFTMKVLKNEVLINALSHDHLANDTAHCLSSYFLLQLFADLPLRLEMLFLKLYKTHT